MSGRGLLSRLQRTGADRRPDETESILEHLRALLNTRKGDAATAPEFGIHSFTDLVHNFPSAVHIMQKALKATIAEYEPRLKNVLVRHVAEANPLVLRYEISGQLSDRKTLRFNTSVNAGGRFRVW